MKRRFDMKAVEISSKLEKLCREKPEYTKIAAILEEIYNRKAIFKESLNIVGIDESVIAGRLDDGTPLVFFDEIDFDRGKFIRYGHEIEKIFKEKGVPISYPVDFESYFTILTEGLEHVREKTEKNNVKDGVTEYIVFQAIKPLYEKYREIYEKFFSEGKWLQPYCFLCGTFPNMAIINDEGGKRYLYCGMCEASWYYPKLKCPFCGNENQDSLVRIEFEDDKVYSIDACNVCRRYIKVVDRRQKEEGFVFDIEDVLSVHMDMAAEKEGFINSDCL